MEYRTVTIEIKGVTETVEIPKRNKEPMYSLFNRAIAKMKNNRYSFMAFRSDIFTAMPEIGKSVVGNVYMDAIHTPDATTAAKYKDVVFTVVN